MWVSFLGEGLCMSDFPSSIFCILSLGKVKVNLIISFNKYFTAWLIAPSAFRVPQRERQVCRDLLHLSSCCIPWNYHSFSTRILSNLCVQTLGPEGKQAKPPDWVPCGWLQSKWQLWAGPVLQDARDYPSSWPYSTAPLSASNSATWKCFLLLPVSSLEPF